MNGVLENGDIMIAAPRYPLLMWFCARTGQPFHPIEGWGNASVVARIRGLLPVAVIVYNHFHKPDIWMHVAAEPRSQWCTHEFLRALFVYPFTELGCGRVTAVVARRNTAIRKLVSHLGFIEEGKIREALPTGDDLIAYGMLRRECRWIEESVNVETRSTEPA